MYPRLAYALGCAALIALAPPCALRAQDAQDKKTEAKDEAAKDDPKTAERSGEKRYLFEMRGKPWSSVIEWLSDNSGLPFISKDQPPPGTFSYIAPRIGKGPQRTYTLAEIIDIVNEGLLASKFVLIRRDASFMLFPADEKIPPEILPRILLEELPRRGNTEIVSLVMPLRAVVAEDIAPEVKKMMGPFGEVAALKTGNHLMMQDTAGNLRRIMKDIQLIEENEKGGAEVFSHKCMHIRASNAAQILREFLGDAKQIVESTKTLAQSPMGPGSSGSDRDRDRDRPPFGGFSRPSVTVQTIRVHTITADDRTNTVHINGPASKIAQAKAVLAKIDVPQADGQQPLLMNYQVPAGNADALTRTLLDIYKGRTDLRIVAVGAGQIMVFAPPEDQIEIARLIQGGGRLQTATTELIPLSRMESDKAALMLKAMFGDPKTGAPYIEAEPSSNSIAVRGTIDQVKEVKLALSAITSDSFAESGKMRIITLEKGSAASLAEALNRLLPQMRPNEVKIIRPGDAPLIPDRRPVPAPERKPEERKPILEQPISYQDGETQGTARGGAQPEAAGKKEAKPGEKAPPITIMAFGNRLIVSSDDPDALRVVNELVRMMTRESAGEGDFQVIPLKYANAADAAKVLDEIFNGPLPQQRGGGNRGQGGPFGGGFGGPFGGGPFGQFGGNQGGGGANLREDRIRVVADTGTNSLLVRAKPIDMITIRDLLNKSIDTGSNSSDAVIRTWIVGPLKHASALDVANVIRDVYRESMNNNPATTRGGSGIFGSRQPSLNIDPQGNPRGVLLSVGVDDKTNSLVLACPKGMYEDIKKLVEELETASADSKQVVKVVPIKGIDPLLVQQALDAIQGRTSTTNGTTSRFGGNNTSGGTSSPFRSGLSPGGFSPGGFSPGGFSPGGFSPGGFSPGGFRPSGFSPGGSRDGGRSSDGGSRSRGGRQSSSLEPPGRGPDFFAQAVKDDHLSPILYDPAEDLPAAKLGSAQPTGAEESAEPELLVPISTQDAAQPRDEKKPADKKLQPDKQGPKDKSEAVTGPRLPVRAEALEELGVIVLSGSPEDVEKALQIIEFIQRLGSGAEIEFHVVPLKQADATSIVSTLNQMFSRVQISPSSTTPAVIQQRPGGQQQPQFPFFGQQQQQPQQQQAQAVGVVMIPLVRQNAILLAAPKARLTDILREIDRLDQPFGEQGRAVPFALKRAPAWRVATMIQQFYADRFPNETRTQNQIRITYDDSSNTVFVQAGPADLAEIQSLIERIDNTPSLAVNELRVIPLRNAVAEDLANIITRAIAEGFIPTTGQAGGVFPQAGGQQPGGQQPFGQQQFGQQQLGQQGGFGAQQQRPPTKVNSLSFRANGKDGRPIVTGILDDIRITPDPRTNTLVISAPEKTMQLVLALVRELDVVPAARSEVRIFHLKKADAAQLATTLQQFFIGGQRTGQQVPGAPGQPGVLGQALTGAAQQRPLQITLGGTTPDGAAIIDLRIAIDERTNSLVVVGSENDLAIIEAVIARIEDADIQVRRMETIRLRNAQAADVAAALNDFFTKDKAVLEAGNQFTAFQTVQREVVIAVEPISNSLLVSATPQYFEEVMRLITQLDLMPPQIVIQVLVAEVDFADTNEFGVELGLQSPVLFQRGIIPFGGTGGSVNYTAPATGFGLVPPGVSVNSTINPVAFPGYNFNSTQPLGNNPLADSKVVGYQGIGNLGVGRISPTQNIGGFVFSAASESFNLLIRSLRVQNRIDILSRPVIMTLDKQTAFFNVGQDIPIVADSSATLGVVTSNIERRNVGVLLQVTPTVMPDGRVLMRIVPEVSSVVPTPVPLGNNQLGTALNIQHLETTVAAYDGETIAIGGLITTKNTKTENKIPGLGDIPGLGVLFRYRTQTKAKVELLVVLTPHVVYSRADAERVLAEEARRMDWITGDVLKVYGPGFLDGAARCGPTSHVIEPAPALEAAPEPRPYMPSASPQGMAQPLPSAAPNLLPQTSSVGASEVGPALVVPQPAAIQPAGAQTKPAEKQGFFSRVWVGKTSEQPQQAARATGQVIVTPATPAPAVQAPSASPPATNPRLTPIYLPTHPPQRVEPAR